VAAARFTNRMIERSLITADHSPACGAGKNAPAFGRAFVHFVHGPTAHKMRAAVPDIAPE
jgi:hypothetical protein